MRERVVFGLHAARKRGIYIDDERDTVSEAGAVVRVGDKKADEHLISDRGRTARDVTSLAITGTSSAHHFAYYSPMASATSTLDTASDDGSTGYITPPEQPEPLGPERASDDGTLSVQVCVSLVAQNH